MKKALIVGCTGQDGNYLFDILKSNDYSIVGISSSKTISNFEFSKIPINIKNYNEVAELIQNFIPDEIYYLAAYHHSSVDVLIDELTLFSESLEINTRSYLFILETCRKYSPTTRIFYAASSHIFGNPEIYPQTENTPVAPICMYGITKAAGLNLSNYYRSNYSLFVSVGILYNHESPLRSSKFVSKKIIENAVAIKLGHSDKLEIGNLNSIIDWGYAQDYMEAAFLLLQSKSSDNFIIASGTSHSVLDFVKSTFNYLNMNWTEYVIENPTLIAKKERRPLIGNNEKIKKVTGWKPKVDLMGLIKIMVDDEKTKYKYDNVLYKWLKKQ